MRMRLVTRQAGETSAKMRQASCDLAVRARLENSNLRRAQLIPRQGHFERSDAGQFGAARRSQKGAQ